MPIQVVKDPQTGQEKQVYVAPKASASPPKPAAKQQDGGVLGAIGNALSSTPLGVVPAVLGASGAGIGAAVNTLQRTGDVGQASGQGSQAYMGALEGPGVAKGVARTVANASRNAVQELSDLVTADIPAAFGDTAVKPTSAAMPDAPFLGVLPALPKAKSSGPAEDFATGVAQVAIEWLPAAKAVGLVGKGLQALPGAARVAKGAKAAGDSYRAAKATQIAKLAPGLQKPATIAAGAGEAIVSNVVGKGAATGALIDFAGFDQNTGRLYDLADRLTQQVTGTPLEIPFLDYLKSKPGDVGLSGRLKNAVEGTFVGSSVEFLMRAFRAAKYVDRLRNAAPDEVLFAAQAAKEATEDLEAEMVRQGTQAQQEAVAALPPARVAAAAPQEIPVVPIGQVVDEAVPPAAAASEFDPETQSVLDELQALADSYGRAGKQEAANAQAALNESAGLVSKEDMLPTTGQSIVPGPRRPLAAAADELPPLLFHGTSAKNAAAIREGGFKASGMRGDIGNALGDGVFFTSDPRYARDYGPEMLSGNPAAAGLRIKTLTSQQYEDLIVSKYGGFGEFDFPKDQQALIKEFGEEFDGVRVTEGFGGPGNNVGDEIVIFDPKKADALISGQQAPAAAAPTPTGPLLRPGAELYHGTTAEGRKGIMANGFRVSEAEKAGTVLGEGVYFAGNERYAAAYGGKSAWGQLPDDAKILDLLAQGKTVGDLADEIGVTGPRKTYGEDVRLSYEQQQQVKDWALANGYDGIRYRSFDTPDKPELETVIYNVDLANRLVGSKAAAAAPEPSVPSAGTSEPAQVVDDAAPAAPVAGPTPDEIRELDATLTKSMANLPVERRVEIRNQMLAQKYGPAPEPQAVVNEPAPRAMEQTMGSPAEPVVEPPPVDVVPPAPDEAWAQKLTDQMLANRELLESGDVTMQDLLTNNVQKLESPSGATKYQPVQPPLMVESYRAYSDLVDRVDATGIPVMTDERIITDTAAWLEKANYSSQAVLENLKRLSGPLSAYRDNLVALRAAALYVDDTNLQAGIAANRWLNGQMDEAADMGKLTAELVTAAAQQDRANRALESVTRPLGQLLRSTQIPRPAPGSIPFDDAAAPVGKNIAEEMEQALVKDQQELVADSIGARISPEAQEAILTGQYDSPKVIEEFNALALNMAQSAVTPGFSQGFWKKFNSSLNLGVNGLMLYRSSQLLSSGITLWGNVINSALRTVEMPLTQAAGALVTGHPVRASRSLMIYGQYVSNLANAFRMGVESFKVGRGLFDMDRSQVDFLDRLAKQDADAEMLASPQQAEWDLNTLPWVSIQDKSNWAMAQKRLWQGLNLSTRLQVSADSAFKTLVGQSFEYVRNLQPGLDHAVRMGMDGNSKEAWRFAQDYAQAAVDRNLKDVTIDGRTILDAVMESPHAQTATRWATFTDDIWASMETRTTTRGMELAQAKGLKGDEAIAYAQEYVEKGQKVLGMGMDDIPFFARTFSVMPRIWQMGLDSPMGPLFALIQPFNRTPGDIVKSVARKTPLAPLVDTWWRDVFSEDAMTRDRAWGDIATGAAAISLASIAMTHGRIEFTGGGPGNPDAKRKWMEQDGKQPYSFRIRMGEDENGNPMFSDWISMRALDPYASLFGGLADYHELANKVTTEARERLGSALVMDLVSAVAAGQLQKSYYQGFTEVYEMAMGLGELDIAPNRRHPVARYVERLVASFIPGSSSLRAGRRIEDPIARDVPASNNPNLVMRLFEETSSEIKNMLPGYSTELPPKRNWITGDPIFLSGVWGDQFLPPESPWLSYALQFSPASPFQKKAQPGEVVLREMGQLTGRGAGFIGPRATDFTDGGKIKENRLSPYEYEEYVLAISRTPDQFGRTLLQALEEEVTSDLYKENPPGRPSEQVVSFRAAALNQVIAQYLKLGRETFLSSPAGKRLVDNKGWAEGANRDVQFRLKYGQEIDPQSFIEGLR